MKDYSKSIEPIEFRVNEDVFKAVPTLPGGLLKEFDRLTREAAELGEDAGWDSLDGIFEFLDRVLLPGSAERFAERMVSLTEPIDHLQAVEIFTDLLKVYTGSESDEVTEAKAVETPSEEGVRDESTRPTLAVSSSSDGSATTGTSSEAEPSLSVASTPSEQMPA